MELRVRCVAASAKMRKRDKAEPTDWISAVRGSLLTPLNECSRMLQTQEPYLSKTLDIAGVSPHFISDLLSHTAAPRILLLIVSSAHAKGPASRPLSHPPPTTSRLMTRTAYFPTRSLNCPNTADGLVPPLPAHCSSHFSSWGLDFSPAICSAWIGGCHPLLGLRLARHLHFIPSLSSPSHFLTHLIAFSPLPIPCH